MIRKIITSVTTYSISYLPMVTMIAAGGVQLQGQYAIQRYYFDLFNAILLLGMSQSIFKLANSVPFSSLARLHKIASTFLFIIVSATVLAFEFDYALILIVLSALFYSIGLVGRMSLIIDERVGAYQLINALFPLILGLSPLIIYPYNENHILYMILLSATISLLATCLVGVRIDKSEKKNLTKEEMISVGLQSWQGLVFQLVQFSFPLTISLILLSNNFGKNEIGLFSIAYTTMAFVYAPATIFGPNIVAFMYKTDGKISFEVIKYLSIGGLATSLLILILYFGLKEIFKIEMSYINYTAIYVVAILPLFAVSRLITPILIWTGGHVKLIVCELARFVVGILFFGLITTGSYFNFLIGLIISEIAYMVVSIHYFYKQSK